ncbi:helix-turn-helix domain-containing protein [Streptomyces sp. NBC_01304]|uniref:helix-turn-helix domain-containing protein n=1 Tax=Streptomyces sp. NBC_01304 TaxID=2903818 RepID=UPI002E158688|nr:helix-turn-helix domain-containing protein [Streptomyces sp. NBC_01304]
MAEDQARSSAELARILRDGPFELAVQCALRDSGLSLERVAARLRISGSSLSNWQTGRSRPERPDSLRALRGLEQLLELPADSLLRLLGPRRPRGRWLGHVPGSVRYDALFDDHARLDGILAEVRDADEHRYRAVSVHERATIDGTGRYQVIEVHQVVTTLVDGVDACVAFFHAEDGPVPEIAAADSCRIGRRHTDPAAGIAVAELLLDCRLDRGDVFLLEYRFEFPATGEPPDYYYRAFRNPAREYLLRVRFHPQAVPVRCFSFAAPRLGAPDNTSMPLICQRGRPAHMLVTDHPPGIFGIRWEWR